jgi:hypothetical protein
VIFVETTGRATRRSRWLKNRSFWRALMTMEDSDAELGHPEEAQKSRELAARLKATSGGN